MIDDKKLNVDDYIDTVDGVELLMTTMKILMTTEWRHSLSIINDDDNDLIRHFDLILLAMTMTMLSMAMMMMMNMMMTMTTRWRQACQMLPT